MPAPDTGLSEGSAPDTRAFHEDRGMRASPAPRCPSSSSTQGPRGPPPPAGVASPEGDSRLGEEDRAQGGGETRGRGGVCQCPLEPRGPQAWAPHSQEISGQASPTLWNGQSHTCHLSPKPSCLGHLHSLRLGLATLGGSKGKVAGRGRTHTHAQHTPAHGTSLRATRPLPTSHPLTLM